MNQIVQALQADYEVVVGVILAISFFGAFVVALLGFLFPKTDDDATDPYVSEYPGVSAPREDV